MKLWQENKYFIILTLLLAGIVSTHLIYKYYPAPNPPNNYIKIRHIDVITQNDSIFTEVEFSNIAPHDIELDIYSHIGIEQVFLSVMNIGDSTFLATNLKNPLKIPANSSIKERFELIPKDHENLNPTGEIELRYIIQSYKYDDKPIYNDNEILITNRP